MRRVGHLRGRNLGRHRRSWSRSSCYFQALRNTCRSRGSRRSTAASAAVICVQSRSLGQRAVVVVAVGISRGTVVVMVQIFTLMIRSLVVSSTTVVMWSPTMVLVVVIKGGTMVVMSRMRTIMIGIGTFLMVLLLLLR